MTDREFQLWLEKNSVKNATRLQLKALKRLISKQNINILQKKDDSLSSQE